MRVLGIDPGSHRLGYGCIEVDGPRLTYVEAGELRARASGDLYERLQELGGDLEQVIDELKPEAVGIEAGFVKQRNAVLALGGARAVAAYIVGKRGIAVREYSPATVKQAATGRGDATKEHVALLVARLLRMRRQPSPDAGDALAVALARAADLRLKL